MEIKSGIYKITNIINNRYYIGSSVNIPKRWLEHKRLLNKGKHENVFLQKSWDKHGEDCFNFEVLEIITETSKLLVREQYYLNLIKPFNENVTYNICETAGNMLGFKHSDETKEKMSIIQLKRFRDQEERVKCNIFRNLTEKESDKVKKNMSESHKGIKHSPETKINMIKFSLGRRQTDKVKLKLSKINKGRKVNNKRKVYQLDLNGNIIKLWGSLTEAGEHFNINPSRICAVCNGRAKTCIGFKWRYFNHENKKTINDETKNKIKSMYQTGLFSTRELASIFDISKSSVWQIVNKF